MKNQLKTELNNDLKKGKKASAWLTASQNDCLGADWTETVLCKQQKREESQCH